MTAQDQMPDIAEFFAQSFGGAPQAVASAPGRVNLIGEHVDYNGGQVLPMAIERRTWVAVRERKGGVSVAVSANEPARGEFDAHAPARSGHWWDYVAGVAAMLTATGARVPQFEVAVTSDVPQGAGLSSSAALEVATAAALSSLAGSHAVALDWARAGWRAETGFVGVPSGIMDQFASALGLSGHALRIWCDTGATEQVPFTQAVLIFDTALPRSLRNSAFETRRAECQEALRLLRMSDPELPDLAAATPEQVIAAALPDPLGRRALHVARETRRVQKCVEALGPTGTLPGELLFESHESLRYLYECSTPELNWFVERAATVPGIRGARLTGAGWGGCAIAVGEPEALRQAAAMLPGEYRAAFAREPRTWLTHAAGGAEQQPASGIDRTAGP